MRAEVDGVSAVRAAPGPVIDVRPEGDRAVVRVRGDLDLDATRPLERGLRTALVSSVHGVDLDLSEVGFCDCSALNVLLAARRRALVEGKTLDLRATAPTVDRVLDLTGTRSLFADPDRATEQGADGEALRELRVEVVQLRRAMQTRPVIDLARGILMASFGLSSEEAWRVLVTASQHANTKLHHLARDIVSTAEGGEPREQIRDQLAAAVTRVRTESP
ncbi:ANTAR domain-containing protein [Streptomyces longwoodensis]|uniref:ANTAR domain-containing protein n=1 Tax=Streptomyces longwoodensis TaxID=68231 RepID=UPI0022535F5E|nr:ANTAR domain-containing protein [Streptomyces longwoodensis]MCX4997557.1 ANTAR domain-containing protein [Streptomyces longwoodensis]WUC69842.1 ANTAR domain-containing protein [Streptomyces longwoodensis]